MTAGRKPRRSGENRDGTYFVALPILVLDAPRYIALSSSARALLIDLARQAPFGKRNGNITAASTVLKGRGWTSPSTIARALKELLEAGFIARTRYGSRHRCALFALTWYKLDAPAEKLDSDLVRLFRRGVYLVDGYVPNFLIRAPALGRRKFGDTDSIAQAPATAIDSIERKAKRRTTAIDSIVVDAL